jgi:hypothetical protein
MPAYKIYSDSVHLEFLVAKPKKSCKGFQTRYRSDRGIPFCMIYLFSRRNAMTREKE